MSDINSCVGMSKDTLIFACSGAADVGHLTDLAARKMTKNRMGRMFCTVGIGGRVSGIIQTTEAAKKILALDGCQLDCVKHSLEQAGFKNYTHLRLTDIGLEKGQSPATEENIARVVEKTREILN